MNYSATPYAITIKISTSVIQLTIVMNFESKNFTKLMMQEMTYTTNNAIQRYFDAITVLSPSKTAMMIQITK